MEQELNRTKSELFQTKSVLSQTQSELNATRQQLEISENASTTSTNISHEFDYATAYNNHIYLLSNKRPLIFKACQSTCGGLGGYLVEIDSQDEFSHLTGFLSDQHLGSEWVVLGITDAGTEGHWTYMTSGGSAQVLEWGPRQPSDGTAENCAFLSTYNMKMYDVSCLTPVISHIGRFLCEVPV